MATKNSKSFGFSLKEGFARFSTNLQTFAKKAWKWGRFIIRFTYLIIALLLAVCVVLPIAVIFHLAVFLMSPLWYPLQLWLYPEKAAERILTKDKVSDDTWLDELVETLYLWWPNWLYCTVLRNIVMPFTGWLPMSYRRWFIQYDEKPIHEYPTQTQVEYYLSCLNTQVLKSLSPEAIEILWEEGWEKRFLWENILATRGVNREQLNILLKEDNEMLLRHLEKQTPSSEFIRMIIDVIREKNSEAAKKALLTIVRKNDINARLLELIIKLGDDVLTACVNAIIDAKAEVAIITDNSTGSLQNWYNLCATKESISTDAQAMMSYDQYRVFAESKHTMDKKVLTQKLVLLRPEDYDGDRLYVKALLANEWESIDEEIISFIKTNVGSYKLYLAEKARRTPKDLSR